MSITRLKFLYSTWLTVRFTQGHNWCNQFTATNLLFFLNYFVSTLANPLAHVYSCLLSSRIVPAQLKIAKVVPIHKSADCQSIDNNPSISPLSKFSKIWFRKRFTHSKHNSLCESRVLKKGFTTLGLINWLSTPKKRYWLFFSHSSLNNNPFVINIDFKNFPGAVNGDLITQLNLSRALQILILHFWVLSSIQLLTSTPILV